MILRPFRLHQFATLFTLGCIGVLIYFGLMYTHFKPNATSQQLDAVRMIVALTTICGIPSVIYFYKKVWDMVHQTWKHLSKEQRWPLPVCVLFPHLFLEKAERLCAEETVTSEAYNIVQKYTHFREDGALSFFLFSEDAKALPQTETESRERFLKELHQKRTNFTPNITYENLLISLSFGLLILILVLGIAVFAYRQPEPWQTNYTLCIVFGIIQALLMLIPEYRKYTHSLFLTVRAAKDAGVIAHAPPYTFFLLHPHKAFRLYAHLQTRAEQERLDKDIAEMQKLKEQMIELNKLSTIQKTIMVMIAEVDELVNKSLSGDNQRHHNPKYREELMALLEKTPDSHPNKATVLTYLEMIEERLTLPPTSEKMTPWYQVAIRYLKAPVA